MSDRFRPTRAGVINVWDYVDEEWMFAGGRLALRGHNGSGKTKALEVLFPFVLDGVADSRRLDPFSGENRTMKSNLLYRGQESEYGYVWMEFARPDFTELNRGGLGGSSPRASTVTLIIGMRAHRNTDGVRMSFYVTGRRLGVDFGLLSADSRPLTERQLRAVLEPDAWRKTATEYRDLVDARLFGLGRERYAQLLDLLLALRRPLLAKDLDPVKVSDTLTSGLSPVDDYLVQQAARDFENLAAVQKTVRRPHRGRRGRPGLPYPLHRLPAGPRAVPAGPGAGQGRGGDRARGNDHRSRREPPPRGRGRASGRGAAQCPARRRRDAAGPPGGAEKLRRVPGAGPDRGQAPRAGGRRARGRGSAQPARPGPPRARRSRDLGEQAGPARGRGPGRRVAVHRRPDRRRPAVRHHRRRLRSGRCRRRPAAGGPGPGRRAPRRRG